MSFRYAIDLRKSWKMRILNASHFIYLSLGKFAHSMKFPRLSCRSILSCFIFVIIRYCSKEKMFGIHARWNITFMAYTHAFRDFTKVYFPGSSMSLQLLGVPVCYSIPTILFGPHPQPTRFTLRNLFPKSNFKFHNTKCLPWEVT